MAALDDEPVVDPFGGVALLVRPPRFDSSTGSTHTSCPARAGLDLGAGVGAASDMSSMSAYFATVLQLTQSLLAISARGTPPASIDRISFIMSWGTVISSTLPGRARQSLRPGIQYGDHSDRFYGICCQANALRSIALDRRAFALPGQFKYRRTMSLPNSVIW